MTIAKSFNPQIVLLLLTILLLPVDVVDFMIILTAITFLYLQEIIEIAAFILQRQELKLFFGDCTASRFDLRIN